MGNSHRTKSRARRTRHRHPDRPATIEELTALHQSPNYRTMIARGRAAETLDRAQQRYEFPRVIYRALAWALDRARGKKP
jgi:nitroimidazol reductase NimA-like FMN-containing flavoprotein (pyridoxamine 5'-phosphate oxidase superfamily)